MVIFRLLLKRKPEMRGKARRKFAHLFMRFLTLMMLQNMNDLQTVAFESSAYDPVANGNDSKEELKEVEIEKEAGYRKQDFTETASGLSISRNAEINDPV